MAASERRDGGRRGPGGSWAAALASSFDGVIDDDPPGLADVSGTGKGRDGRNNTAPRPQRSRRTEGRGRRRSGVRARTKGPPSASGVLFDGGAGTGTDAGSFGGGMGANGGFFDGRWSLGQGRMPGRGCGLFVGGGGGAGVGLEGFITSGVLFLSGARIIVVGGDAARRRGSSVGSGQQKLQFL